MAFAHSAPLVTASLLVFLWAAHDGWSGSLSSVSFFDSGSPASSLRFGILETDSWLEDVADGAVRPATRFPARDRWQLWWNSLRSKPQTSLSLMHGAAFTPSAYLDQIEPLARRHPDVCDVLLYYGGWRPGRVAHGLNFNSWSVEELRQLRSCHARPFIGLETFDRMAIRLMARRLEAAGYRASDPLLIRLAAEPSGAAYGSETGTAAGRRGTPKAHDLYRAHFCETAEFLRACGRRYHLNLLIVFAGDRLADFAGYLPPASAFDLVGLDLYVTPQNRDQKMALLTEISRRWPKKPLVLAELGIATAGANATPAWARGALADVLSILERHPAGPAQITVFSVDVAARLKPKRWSWAWTPAMYQMLAEWQAAQRRWHPEGFHRYDLASYPVGKDVFYLRSASLRISYRRLRSTTAQGEPLFCETLLRRAAGQWQANQREVALIGQKLVPLDALPAGALASDDARLL